MPAVAATIGPCSTRDIRGIRDEWHSVVVLPCPRRSAQRAPFAAPRSGGALWNAVGAGARDRRHFLARVPVPHPGWSAARRRRRDGDLVSRRTATPRIESLQRRFVPPICRWRSTTTSARLSGKSSPSISRRPDVRPTQSPVRETHEQPALDRMLAPHAGGSRGDRARDGLSARHRHRACCRRQHRLAHRPEHSAGSRPDGRSEIDALYTVPLDMARIMGVPTPTLDLLVSLIKVKAQSAGYTSG